MINKMDESKSSAQLKEEIAALTKSVAQLETEISAAPEPLRQKETRVIDLGRFRRVQDLFSKWNDDSADIIDDRKPVTNTDSPESRSQNVVEDGVSVHTNDQDDDEELIFRMSEDGDSALVRSQESFQTTSNDDISPLERAHMRILAVLSSYLRNLGDETLVASWNNDGKVATALKDLLEKSDLKDHGVPVAEGLGADNFEDLEFRDMSDEEGVVCELDQYRKTLLESGNGVADTVLEVAKQILEFGK